MKGRERVEADLPEENRHVEQVAEKAGEKFAAATTGVLTPTSK